MKRVVCSGRKAGNVHVEMNNSSIPARARRSHIGPANKQLKARELRELRTMRITSIHRHLFTHLAIYLHLDVKVIEDFVCDSDEQMTLLEKFCKEKGSKSLTFFYQEAEKPKHDDCGLSTSTTGRFSKPAGKERLFITKCNSESVCLKGLCLYFIRKSAATELCLDGIADMLTFCVFDASGGILPSIIQFTKLLIKPSLEAAQSWDTEGSNIHINVKDAKQHLLDEVDSFIHYIECTQASIDGTITLQESDTINLNECSTLSDCAQIAASSENVNLVEELVISWCTQMDRLLAACGRMRKEADSIGPMSELEHWRQLAASFNSIVDQIKGHQCRMAISVLQIAKSRVLKRWHEFDKKITDAGNEAKDNIKYLYTLERFCEPLYRANPTVMAKGIPSLVNAINMIQGTSRYYNTSERMTSLFIKVTNQIVESCKAYLTNGNSENIWEQERNVVLDKLQACGNLYEDYKEAIQRAKQKTIEIHGSGCGFSERNVFGKLDSFCKRLGKLTELLKIIDLYSPLADTHIDGMERFANRFKVIFGNMRKKPNDMLEFRKPDFDNDFEDFQRNVDCIREQIQEFMETVVTNSHNSCKALGLLKLFEELNLPGLTFDEKYNETLHSFALELDDVQQKYQKFKDDVPLARNMPPVAGKINWVRQLYRKIRDPMEIFSTYDKLLKTDEGKRVVKSFNRLAAVLLEYEIMYHMAWVQSLEHIGDALHVHILVRNHETGQLYVNFDPFLFETIRESDVMLKMGLELPEIAKTLHYNRHKFKTYCNKLDMMLHTFKHILEDIPPMFLGMMQDSVEKVETSFRAGVVYHTWSSLNLEMFFADVNWKLNDLKQLVKHVRDLKATHIDETIEYIGECELYVLPESGSWRIGELVHNIHDHTHNCSRILDNKSRKCEEAANNLIRLFMKRAGIALATGGKWMAKFSIEKMTDGEIVLREECAEMFCNLSQRTTEAIVKSTRSSLDYLRRRILFASMVRPPSDSIETQMFSRPILTVDITLEIPNVTLNPSLDEIQHCISKCAKLMIETSKGIAQWGQERHASKLKVQFEEVLPSSDDLSVGKEIPPKDLKNFYRSTMDNKDVNKNYLIIGSSLQPYKEKIHKAISDFEKYSYLWTGDRESVALEFLKSDPLQTDFEDKISKYDDLLLEVKALPKIIIVGPFALHTEKLKLALSVEIKEWQMTYAKQLYLKYKPVVVDITNFAEEELKCLSKPINNLGDVRFAMASLEKVRQRQMDIDLMLRPIEEAYAMLTGFGVAVPSEELNKVDGLRYLLSKLITSAAAVQDSLAAIQPELKQKLIQSLAVFAEEMGQYEHEYDTIGPMAAGIDPQDASDRLNVFQNRFDELFELYESNSAGEELFGLHVTPYPNLNRIKKELALLQRLYGLYNSVMNTINGYFDILWKDVDTESMKQQLTEFQNRCRKLPKGVKEWPAYLHLKKKIDDFAASCPLLELIANKALVQRHWDRMSAVTGHTFDIDSETFCLRDVMNSNLLDFRDNIEDICISASKENDIEAKLNLVIADWTTQTLHFASFKNRGEIVMKSDETSQVIALLEDSLVVLASLMSNRYNAPFKPAIQSWMQSLSTALDIIEDWMNVQNLWVYLEAIFVGGDIAKKLPQEAKRFAVVDNSWVKIMHRAHEVQNVISCCVVDTTLTELLPHMSDQLDLCQKSLAGYLEIKRTLFPRFYFVSDPVLLEILGQANDPPSIQQHLCSVFANIAALVFHEKDTDRIVDVVSGEGEHLCLRCGNVNARGNVEFWLGELLVRQQKALHRVIRDAYIFTNLDSAFDIISFLQSFPSQVGLLGLQMLWTRDAEEALYASKNDKRIMGLMNLKFNELLNKLVEATTRYVSTFERTKLESVITIQVHQRDIFDELTKMNVRSTGDFEWLKQGRFYYKEDTEDCLMSITDVFFVYQCEFMGCNERLVITPLTDRCYITIAQALKMSMGASPTGPAGTGKTETVKDMAKSLGKYSVVFNCSNQMDFRGLGRIFKGLSMSGTWVCFDEFNRIQLPVLSVAAGQIYSVLSAKKEGKRDFVFTDGSTLTMNVQFGIFITMNPGYAGRQELPENLKVQFRTIAMMVPDRQIIIRVKLASCGFMENEILAQKFFTLYKLCEEQLSKQVHYDFGLRNMLSVLRTLASQKTAYQGETEKVILMRVLRNMNLSKLIDEDEPLFLNLIEDLFPGSNFDCQTYPMLEDAIEKHIGESNLINHPPWNLKILQLYETSLVRHGIMSLGPSGSGKSCCIETLGKALTEIGHPHKEIRMNPKAITAAQMFGRLDASTNDWTDGIFSTLWRRCLKLKKADHTWWITLDGPVDAVWIENLNSVLDDNKTLTLANGDRLPMSPNSKVMFEVDNIDNASPATVSRNGMVFMSSSVLEWKPILDGWLKARNQRETTVLVPLFDNVFGVLCDYVTKHLKHNMKVLQCNYIVQACNLLEGLIPHLDDHSGHATTKHLEKLFVFSLMWSLGALLEQSERAKMEQFMSNKRFGLSLPQLKGDETLFDYVVDEDGEWQHWSLRVPMYEKTTDFVPEFSSILIPNIDNVRTTFLVNAIARQEMPVLLIGEQGTAKSVMIKSYMASMESTKFLKKCINFSSATSPMNLQRTCEGYVEKRVGSTYGPPGGRKMVVFIDDISMPVVNEWGDQATNELLRQTIEAEGFYNVDKPGDFTHIVDIQILSAMIHPGGGRNDIPERLKRHFAIFNCTLPSNNSIDCIFGTIATGHFAPDVFNAEVCHTVQELVSITRVLVHKIKMKMLPTPTKFHYVFNLRDLSRIWEGMLYIRPKECDSVRILLALWKHECTRVLADRFTTEDDKQWFEDILKSMLLDRKEGDVTLMLREDIYFVDFLRDVEEVTIEEHTTDECEEPKVYELSNVEAISARLKYYAGQYNENVKHAKMDLVFYKDCVSHFVRISRIIRTKRGSALLVGVGGSGKNCITQLATFVAGYEFFKISLSRTYNVNNLIDDLKYLYKVSGLKGKGVTFLFSDDDIKGDSFLEYLNNILGTGEISNLFARDELETITETIIPIMKKEGQREEPSQEEAYQYFIKRAQNNLHLVLSFSPMGDDLRGRALRFPGLISGCTIDWYHRWPKDALVAVSTYSLTDFDVVITPESKLKLMEVMGDIHDGVHQTCNEYFNKFRRQTHVTPPSFLSFIAGYKEIYQLKYDNYNNLAQRMGTGLDKLTEATHSLDDLSQELERKEGELVVANTKADDVLKVVTTSAQAAEQVKAAVQKVKDKAQAIVDGIVADKIIAEETLEAAKPVVEAAEAALLTIKPAHIATVKKLSKPPHLVMRIMDCTLLLFQKRLDSVTLDIERMCPKPSWSESQKMMSSTSFLTNLINFPKDSINDEIVELMAPYLEIDDYTSEVAKKVCGDVAGLLSWTVAMATYHGINKTVLPLKANLVVQENKLELATQELDAAQQCLDEKEIVLNQVRELYDDAVREKRTLISDAEACKRKMTIASTLIDGLSGEEIRWTEQSQELKDKIVRLAGDAVLVTGFLSYAGPFNQEFRNMMQLSWADRLLCLGIPHTERLNVVDILADKARIREWTLQGLPDDTHSIQNSIIVTEAARYPLIIDPQGQGKAWIKQKEKSKGLKITSVNHKLFRNHLEDALSLGHPLMVENIDEVIDNVMDNVLKKKFVKTGTVLRVKIGDRECDVIPGFYMYLVTNISNPTYSAEISARTSIIDFTVTQKGLEDQLLSRVIVTEKRDLETSRVALLEELISNDIKMRQLEDNLLFKLTSSEGSLVEDESLVTVLHTTRTMADEVGEKLTIAAETEVKVNYTREEFRPVANRGSLLYFLICEMSMINCMYQTSIDQFLGLFDKSMGMSKKSIVTSQRITNIIDFLTFEVFRYTCRGLYESHKFLFTLLLTLKIDLMRGSISQEEFDVFVHGGAGLDINSMEPKPCKWILDASWLNIVMLSKLHKFPEILTDIPTNEKLWKAWMDNDAPELEAMPDEYDNLLDEFLKLLLIRALCPDRVVSQAKRYIGASLGTKYTEPCILKLEKTWGESTSRTPLICLLSLGSDPTGLIEILAKKVNKSYQAISMGQGQEIPARTLVRKYMVSGGWILLQNCHLSLDFMEELRSMVSEEPNTHLDFRVWLTTEEHVSFPITLLQSSIKFTNEPPHGMNAGLKRTFASITNDLLDFNSLPQWKPLLFAVSFLHCGVQERRKYGHLGWNIPYEFNRSDWLASVTFLQNYMDDIDPRKGVSWTTVRYMIGEVQYGGRVTDVFDKRLLSTLVKTWFGEQLFADSFCFYDGYAIPKKLESVEEIEHFISGLPTVETPEVVGLHTNADVTYQSFMTMGVLETIINIQPKDKPSKTGETRESFVYQQAGEMLSKLPDEYVMHEVLDSLKRMDILQPLNIFLRQEIDRMQRVISHVKATLTELKLAIDGTIIMNACLRDALNNIYNARVPKNWAKLSWESTTIGFWFTELIDRNEQFQSWLSDGRPSVFWLTGFFNPRGFLTAMRQEVTRLHKGWALDTVSVYNDVLKLNKEDVQSPPLEGVLVHGLFLEGASWDRRNGRLMESSPKVLFSRLPVIHIYAVNTTATKESTKLYQCPVYKKATRNDLTYITCIALKTGVSTDKWILRGVAALCKIT